MERKNPYRHLKYAYSIKNYKLGLIIIVCGIGYGFTSNIFQMSNIVRDLNGPGTLGYKTKYGYEFIAMLSIYMFIILNFRFFKFFKFF